MVVEAVLVCGRAVVLVHGDGGSGGFDGGGDGGGSGGTGF